MSKYLMYEYICSGCGKVCYTRYKMRLKFANNFCDRKCYNKFQKKTGMFENVQRKPGWKHTEEAKDKISLAGIGNKYNLGRKLTLEHRKKISKAHGGEKSSLWRGGVENIQGYTPLFSKQLKERIRVRDNFHCRICGIPELECKKRLAIHHIDYNKHNCKVDNLISLCQSCHNKTNLKRKFYKSLLSKEMRK